MPERWGCRWARTPWTRRTTSSPPRRLQVVFRFWSLLCYVNAEFILLIIMGGETLLVMINLSLISCLNIHYCGRGILLLYMNTLDQADDEFTPKMTPSCISDFPLYWSIILLTLLNYLHVFGRQHLLNAYFIIKRLFISLHTHTLDQADDEFTVLGPPISARPTGRSLQYYYYYYDYHYYEYVYYYYYHYYYIH